MKLPQNPWEGTGALVCAGRCPVQGLKTPRAAQNSPITTKSPSLQLSDGEKAGKSCAAAGEGLAQGELQQIPAPLCHSWGQGHSGALWDSSSPGWIHRDIQGAAPTGMEPRPCPLPTRNYPAQGLTHNHSHVGRKVAIKLTPPGTSWPGEGQK